MTHHTLLEDNLGGVDNFQAWKYMISLILEENDLDIISVRKFQNQREMRLRLSIRRTWSRPTKSLQILLRITSSLMFHP